MFTEELTARGFNAELSLINPYPDLGVPVDSWQAQGGPLAATHWVPEGSLAGFLGCVFEVWPAPGARESLQKGGEAPHIFEGFPGFPGLARPHPPKKNLARLPSGTQTQPI